MKAIALLLALALAACAGGRREAPLFSVNVSNNDRADEEIVERRELERRELERRELERERVVERSPPRVVTRLVPTAPPRVCQCR